MRTVSLLFALVAALCACKGESAASPPAPPLSNLFISVSGDGEGRQPPEGFTGTWIDVVPGVEYRQTMVMPTGAEATSEARINGHVFAVQGEYIAIGPQRYGPIAAGTSVEIRNDGVFAAGKLLGPLPEKVAADDDGK